MTDQHDDRSTLATAVLWASEVTTIVVEMVLPALAGRWLDKRLGTGDWFLTLGSLLGLGIGIWQLLRLTARSNAGPNGAQPGSTPASPDRSDDRNETP